MDALVEVEPAPLPKASWPKALDTPEIREAWDFWIAVRREQHSSAKDISGIQREVLLKQLLEMGRASALLSLTTAAASGWKSFRTPDPQRPLGGSTGGSGGSSRYQRNDPYSAPANQPTGYATRPLASQKPYVPKPPRKI